MNPVTVAEWIGAGGVAISVPFWIPWPERHRHEWGKWKNYGYSWQRRSCESCGKRKERTVR